MLLYQESSKKGGGWGWQGGQGIDYKMEVTEGTTPQNSPSETGNRLKYHKTDIHHTFSSLLICPECMNPPKILPCCSQTCTDVWCGYTDRQRTVHQNQTQQFESEFDMKIVSLIVQQLHAGAISLLAFASIWLVLLIRSHMVIG